MPAETGKGLAKQIALFIDVAVIVAERGVAAEHEVDLSNSRLGTEDCGGFSRLVVKRHPAVFTHRKIDVQKSKVVLLEF